MDSFNIKGRMPKDFSQPLTCFYWHTYGICNKSDEDCLYAHYPTGVVAAAPVSLNGGKGPIAGSNATYKLNTQVKREQELQEWESRLQAKEMELNGKNIAGVPCEDLRQIIATGKVSACKVRDALSTVEQLSEADSDKFVVRSIAQASEAIEHLETDLDDLLKLLDSKKSK